MAAQVALLTIDLQDCFIRDSPIAAPEGPAALERLNRLAAVCRLAGITVIHTRVVVDLGGRRRPGSPVKARRIRSG